MTNEKWKIYKSFIYLYEKNYENYMDNIDNKIAKNNVLKKLFLGRFKLIYSKKIIKTKLLDLNKRFKQIFYF